MKDDWKYVFDSINESIMILDLEHRILAANPATVKAAGLPEEELIGSYCYKVFHKSDRPPEDCPHLKITKSQLPFTVDMKRETRVRLDILTFNKIEDCGKPKLNGLL